MKAHGVIAEQVMNGEDVWHIDDLKHVHLVNHLHLLVKNMLEQGKQPASLLPHLQDKVIICNEIGGGIVPMDAKERQWREETGRLCCLIAQQAELVVRIQCGLPQVLKGKL